MNDILDLVVEWFESYASENEMYVRMDGDGFAKINGEFDLRELAEYLNDQL